MTRFKYNERDGTLTEIETVSTLPADFTGVSYCADVHVSDSGKFLYGSNRGHNSIVVFEIDPRTGKLKLVEHVSTEGNWPRNFTIDPMGKFLLVANQRSENVVVFSIDPSTGQLKTDGRERTDSLSRVPPFPLNRKRHKMEFFFVHFVPFVAGFC
jgi:6-phosphogluconolactonase